MNTVLSPRVLVLAIVVAAAGTPALAQPTACDACTRGDAIIDRFGLETLRPLARQLASLSLADPVTTEQYARLIELRQRTPALLRLGAIDDDDLELVAAALCGAADDACRAPTTRALQCLADRCAVALPVTDPRLADVIVEQCDRHVTHRRSPPLGVGLDWGNGWHRSRHPSDGRAWSLGISTRLRITNRIGAVARIDRVAGRDEAEDSDGNGRDDRFTGSITRIMTLAGPTFILDFTRYQRTTRFLRLDLLGGYLQTRSQPDEDGPAAGFDLAYQVWGLRAGVRFVQGFGDARDATTALAHLGFVTGSGPEFSYGAGCATSTPERSTRLAIGLDLPLAGYGISSQLGYMATGLGAEAKWYLTRSLDVVARADLLYFPRYERDRTVHQAVLGGLRIDHGRDTERSSRTGWFTTVLAGYSHGAGLTPTTAGSGPIVDLSLGWGSQGGDGAGWFRLHARSGVTSDNVDYRVLFLTAGFELRLDPRRWRARI